METIDLSLSPVKNINFLQPKIKVKALKNLSNFFNDKDLACQIISEIPEKMSSNLISKDTKFINDKSEIQESPNKEEKGKGRRKRKSSLPSPKCSTTPNTGLTKSNLQENLQGNKSETLSAGNPFQVMKSGETLPSFAKMKNRHEELKCATEKSRQAFSAYKLSTFFCFDSELLKAYGDGLSKVEAALKSMDIALEKAHTKQVSNSSCSPADQLTETDTFFNDEDSGKMEKAEVGSLTPPASEIGNDDKLSLEGNIAPSRKRKVSSGEQEARGKRSTRSRKCTVSTPVAPKVITDFDVVTNEKETVAKVEDTEEKDSDSDTKEGEYEVRKIQDYVRRQNGYFYKVSWNGYDSDDDTYEPVNHLDGCDDVLTEFFVRRLKERESISESEALKSLVLPSDERAKDFLYTAFERLVLPLSKEMKENSVKALTSSKTFAVKTKEEIQEDILKFVALRDPSQDRYKKYYNSIVTQIGIKEVNQERKKQLADLRAWERSMNIISSDPAPLTVENNVDLELPPLDFIYINEYVPAANIIIPSDPLAGCDCKECSPLQKGCCASQMGSYFSYNKYGRLRVSLGTPIYECNKACKCGPDCSNRIVQKGRKVALSIFRTANGRGWGVKALEPIKKDQFVTEYVGEVISSEEAEQRGMKYDTKGCTYLFDLDYNKGDQNPYTVDAVRYGNVSHFINHSCDPNLVVFNVWVNCLDPDLPKLALFAAKDIKKGEEITFDYNSGSTRQISIIDKIDGMEGSFPLSPTKCFDEEGSTIIPTTEFIRKTPRKRVLNAGKTECKCGAANCRNFFF